MKINIFTGKMRCFHVYHKPNTKILTILLVQLMSKQIILVLEIQWIEKNTKTLMFTILILFDKNNEIHKYVV